MITKWISYVLLFLCELDVTRHIWKEVISIEEVSPSVRSIGISMEISLINDSFRNAQPIVGSDTLRKLS